MTEATENKDMPLTMDGFKIETKEDLFEIMSILRGDNPKAQQTVSDFIDFTNKIMRTNLGTRKDVQMLSFYDYWGKVLTGLGFPNNGFSIAANSISVAFMAKGGWLSNLFVELLKQTPSVVDLQTVNEANQQGFIDKYIRRK